MQKRDPLTLPPIDSNQRYAIDEAAAYLRQSISKTYADVACGALPGFKVGKRLYVHGETLIAQSRPRASGSSDSE